MGAVDIDSRKWIDEEQRRTNVSLQCWAFAKSREMATVELLFTSSNPNLGKPYRLLDSADKYVYDFCYVSVHTSTAI